MTYPMPQLEQIRPELHVSVVSAEEASLGVAELWSGREMFGFTRVEGGDLVLRIEPGRDGAAVDVSARGLALALAEATRLLCQEEAI
jgi:hypothetical protein